ncbi:MAG TPA: ATP-binding protein [Chthoniobacteraceae bacterium]|nr:ATP-binding protein [Chthoniobacteraceae bacterium]
MAPPAGSRKPRKEEKPPSGDTLSEILGALGVGFGMFDAQGRLKLHNRLFLSMFGIDPDQVKTGDSFRAILDLFIAQEPTLSGVPDLQAWREERLTNFYENKGNGVDLKVLGRWISTTHHQTSQGEKIFLCTDVTEQMETRQRLECLAEELQRSNRDLEQFASIASHDLQEPLRMVSSYTALLERRYGDRLDEQARTWVRYALDGATRMQRFIADLLEYSRVSTRGRPFVPVDTAEVVRKVLASLRWRIAEKEAVVTVGALPEVTGDEVQLTQIFQNLISNALKFGKRGEPVQIHVEGVNEGGRVRFTVRDNGIGIDPEAAKRVFIMFERLNPHDAYEGSGIGLPICKRIVERHGGSIWVESHEGEGSAFHFTIATGNPYPPPAKNEQDSWEKNR